MNRVRVADMSLDHDSGTDDDSQLPGPSSHHFFGEEEQADVDDALCTLLASLHLEQSRDNVHTEDDDETLRAVHEQLLATIKKEHDKKRQSLLFKAVPTSNCVREKIYCLRLPTPDRINAYYQGLERALKTIVHGSFQESYRRVAIILGLVEALAELLVLELRVFGVAELQNQNREQQQMHRDIRKLTANALTNLTFGQLASKRRLCSYSQFIPTVVKIIGEATDLVKVYSGLIRNLSWQADAPMTAVLSSCVPVLARAAITARQAGIAGESSLRATVKALWNLTGLSADNGRAVCQEPGCLMMLASLLSPAPSEAGTVEGASGVVKYAAQYLATCSSHLQERQLLVSALIQLIGASSNFTIASNALSALASLISKDPHLQMMVRRNGMAMHQLNSLRDSIRDDVRHAVKKVLNHLNQPAGYTPRANEMSSSMGIMSQHEQSSRLLPLRAVRASPGAPSLPPHLTDQQQQHSFNNMDLRSNSLPRHFARPAVGAAAAGFTTNTHASAHASPAHFCVTPNRFAAPTSSQYQQQQHNINMFSQQEPSVNQNQFNMAPAHHNQDECVMDDADELGEDDTDDFEGHHRSESNLCDRSNASRQSLESDMPMNQSGWQSTSGTTANNSVSRLSPVSPSDLPDSPTHEAYLILQREAEERMRSLGLQATTAAPKPSTSCIDTSTPLRISTATSRTGHSTTMTSSSEYEKSHDSRDSRTTDSDATTAIVEDQPTPTFSMFIAAQQKREEEERGRDRAELDLSGSPDDVLPGPSEENEYALLSFGRYTAGGDLDEDYGGSDLLQRSIEAALPKATPGRDQRRSYGSPSSQQYHHHHQNRDRGSDLLAASIQSALPSPKKGGTLTRNHTGASATVAAYSDPDRLLRECIMSAMPSPGGSNQGTLPKNEKGGRNSAATDMTGRPLDFGRLEDCDEHFVDEEEMKQRRELASGSILLEANSECLRDANQLMMAKRGSVDSSEGSEGDFSRDHQLDDGELIDTTLPLDCLEEDDEEEQQDGVTIDCSSIVTSNIKKTAKPSTPTRSSIPQKTKLPKPTTRPVRSPMSFRSSTTSVKPPLAPKPQTQAVVTPYNYQKPKDDKMIDSRIDSKDEKSSAKKLSSTVVHSAANTMLVTTV